MSGVGSNKRFADFLTILLVLVIIGIIVLLGYFGYKAFAKHNIETEAAKAVEKFHKVVDDSDSDDNDDTEETGERADLSGFINNNTEEQTTKANSKKMYLDNYEIIGTIKIPKTGIEYPILAKATVGSLSKAVGVMEIATADNITSVVKDLNVLGTNAYILGHNYRNGQFFSNNEQLSNGDKIYITDTSGVTVEYTIYNMYYTDPDDVKFMQRELDPNVREISLQTCNKDSSQRLIIWAKDS